MYSASSFGMRTENFKNFSSLLTFKGAALFIFVVLLYLGPVKDSADIVAAVLVLALFALILLMLGVNLIYFVRLRKILSLGSEWAPGALEAQESQYPNMPLRLMLRLPDHNLPPFFHLGLQIHFEQPGIKGAIHKIVGTEQRRSVIAETLTFPHRGYWNTDHLNFSLQDGLGIGKTNWRAKYALQFKIVPQRVVYSDLPILSSCNRPGDRVPETSERLGDYYDLKTYHPSDGMRKIVWKIFAKSGNLVARHPEKAMNPEGQLVLFCLANSQEDFVCAAALGYSEMLQEIGIELLAGCEGMGKKSLAKDTEQFEELMTGSVWESQTSDLTSICAELAGCISLANAHLSGNRLERMLIFASRERLTSATGFKQIVQIGEELESRGINPYFVLIESIGKVASEQIKKKGKEHSIISILSSLLLESAYPRRSTSNSLKSEFDSICVKRNWSVIIKS